MKIIGVSGKAECGKSTACKQVDKNKIIPLAKRMKEQAMMLGWDGKKDEKGRRLLQEISWPVKHYFGIDIYAKWCYEQALEKQLDILLVDDVRMMAEVNYFKQLEKDGLIEKFVLVRIKRPGHISKLTKEQLQDISETELDNYSFDYIIVNDSSIEELGNKLKEIIKAS